MKAPPRGFTIHDLNLLIVGLIWGANYTTTKLALGHIAPLTMGALRFTLSTVLLWGLVFGARQHRPIPRPTWLRLLGWGVVGHTLNQFAFLYGLTQTSATNAAVIFGNLPVVVAVLGMIAGHERPGARMWAGIGLGTVGVIVVVGAKGFHFGAETLAGDGVCLLAMLFWAVFTVGVRRAALGLNSAQVAAITHTGGTPGFLIAAAPALRVLDLRAVHPAVWGGVLYSSVLSSVVASVLWTRSLKALGGSRTALYNCVTPIFASLSAWALLGERPVPLQALGAALVILGVLVSQGFGAEVDG